VALANLRYINALNNNNNNNVMNPEEEKGTAAVGRICRKGGFKPGMTE